MNSKRENLIVGLDIGTTKICAIVGAMTDEGLDVDCAASFDNLGPQLVAMLSRRIGRLQDPRTQICAALSALADC